MKYAAIVLFNNKNPLSSVDYTPVTDALLWGGVFLDETVFLPYDAPQSVTSALLRLGEMCDAVTIVCARALLASAREAVSSAAGKPFEEEYLLETEQCLYAVLPEGKQGGEIAKSETVPRIDRRRGNRYSRVILRVACIPPERLQEVMRHAEEAAQGLMSLHVSMKDEVGRIEIIYDRRTPKMTADEVVRIFASELGDHLFSMEDETLAERLVEALKVRRLRLSTAESFTGGGVEREIVRIAGASDVFYEGVGAYNEKAKVERLGVKPVSLQKFGAVSDQVAYEMAVGLLQNGNCDIAVATTGMAGPTSGQTDAPVGTCYFAVGTRERVQVYRKELQGDREQIMRAGINHALFLAFCAIK